MFGKLRKFGVALMAGAALMVAAQSASAASMSTFQVNKLIDFLFKQQAFTPASTFYFGLTTVTPTASSCSGEVSTSSTGYSRVAVALSNSAFAGTQSAGSTTASTGTSGTTSNNAAITFGTPTAPWGSIVGVCVFDSSSAGNLLFFATLSQAKSVNAGDAPPAFSIAAFSFTLN